MLYFLALEPLILSSTCSSTLEGKDLTICGAEALLPPPVLRDFPNEAVKAFVDCLVIFILLAAAAMVVIDIVQKGAGPRITMVLSDKCASSAPVGPCSTVFSVISFVYYERCGSADSRPAYALRRSVASVSAASACVPLAKTLA